MSKERIVKLSAAIGAVVAVVAVVAVALFSKKNYICCKGWDDDDCFAED